MALISEAGLPAVADPGAALVALAHKAGVEVVPFSGPSSLMMALMGGAFLGPLVPDDGPDVLRHERAVLRLCGLYPG